MVNLILALLLVALPLIAHAELPTQLKEDFAPLKAYLVMPVDDQVLVDLDASKGLHTGDILSRVVPGEKIIHPVTGEVIGTLDGSKTFFQVTQLKSGYSYARSLSKSGTAEKGEVLTRFLAVPSIYIDTTGQDPNLKAELETALPQLGWQTTASATTPLLRFERTRAGLSIKSSDGKLLNSYPLPLLSVASTGPSPTPSGFSQTPIAAVLPSPLAVSPQTPAITHSSSSNIWHTAEFQEHPIAIVAGDFDQDGLIETAVLTAKNLRILRLKNRQIQTVANLEISPALTAIGLDSIDLDLNGQPEIYLSTLKAGIPSSSALLLQNGALTVAQEKIPFLLHRIDTSDEGALLLGQKRLDLKIPFTGQPLKMQIQNGQLTETEPYLVPPNFNIYGFSPLPSQTSNSQLFAYFTQTDYLKVRDVQDVLWESADHLGGSETSFNLKPESSDDQQIPFYLPTRLLTLDSGELLTIQNEGPRISRTLRLYGKGRIIAFKWTGVALEESWRTADQSGYIADFTMADIDNDGQAELAALVLFKHESLFSKPRGSLAIYELK